VQKQLGIVEYLHLEPTPHLVGQVCQDCDAVFLDRRNACGRCSGTSFVVRDLASTGTLRTFSVIHRAGPGVVTPYISVIVDLDGGGTVKANLAGDRAEIERLTKEPREIPFGARVSMVTFPAGRDASGVEAVGFGFELGEQPAKESAR
jgi:uncharacterized OB-fold protein